MSEATGIAAVCLSATPSLKTLDQPLLRWLAQHHRIAQWECSQQLDEAISLDQQVKLLHQFLKKQATPLHLIGHGLSGVLGLLYARCYPQQVRSLVLLAVGSQPAATWHAHYYVQRQLFPWSRQQVLARLLGQLLTQPFPHPACQLVKALADDLDFSPMPHSLFRLITLSEGGIAPPLLICGGGEDAIIDLAGLFRWQAWMKPQDQLWVCPAGKHFFHTHHAPLVGSKILGFWESLVPTHRSPLSPLARDPVPPLDGHPSLPHPPCTAT
ncbi:MAG: alpha/beta hydrolase [Cyanobacteriota bacterium]|nr:alpha/beta hydrolase [Cyanobacteriota bacterium]